jgi:predicted DNA-binding WGR domain protein
MYEDRQKIEVFPTVVDLKRVDPSRNMRRFYLMSVQLDLFGGVSLVREWGRMGCRGRVLIEQHADEAGAINALMQLSATKQRRGYRLRAG